MVAAHYIDAGAAVEIPAVSNMPGYDLLIDGSPVQVKCGAGIDLLNKHFEAYPDVPVIANSELAGMVDQIPPEFQHLVGTFDGFDLPHVQEILDRTLDGAQGLADADVPFFAVLVGAGRGAYRAYKGQISVEDLPAWLITELTLRGFLAAGGKLGGGFVGLLVIGPAGALILAPVAGVALLVALPAVKDWLEKRMLAEWHEEVIVRATTLHLALRDALERRVNLLFSKIKGFDKVPASLPAEAHAILYGRAVDDVIHATECLGNLPEPRRTKDAAALLVMCGKSKSLDPSVLGAADELRRALANRPEKPEFFGLVLKR